MRNLKDIILERLVLSKDKPKQEKFEFLIDINNIKIRKTLAGEYRLLGIYDELSDDKYCGYIIKFPKRTYLGDGLSGESLICLQPKYYNSDAYDEVLNLYTLSSNNCICEPGQAAYVLQGSLPHEIAEYLQVVIDAAGKKDFFEGDTSGFSFRTDYLFYNWYEKKK